MPVDLDRLFRRYPELPIMRESARQWLRHLTRNKADGKPLTGSFYWVPQLDRSGQLTWEIEEFFDGWLPSSDHSYVWLHVRDNLERQWKGNWNDAGYACLPRGRVCQSTSLGPADAALRIVIYHGNDCPLGSAGLALVREKFNLAEDTPAIFDIHEQMIQGDLELIPKPLGRRLRLMIPDPEDFDDD